MFNNIGRKIQTLAMAICWIGIGFFVTVGSIALYYGYKTHMQILMAGGVLVLILGPLMSWISIFNIYAFGNLVENVQEIKEQLYQLERTSADAGSDFTPAPAPEPEPFEAPASYTQEDSSEEDDTNKERYLEKYFSQE